MTCENNNYITVRNIITEKSEIKTIRTYLGERK